MIGVAAVGVLAILIFLTIFVRRRHKTPPPSGGRVGQADADSVPDDVIRARNGKELPSAQGLPSYAMSQRLAQRRESLKEEGYFESSARQEGDLSDKETYFASKDGFHAKDRPGRSTIARSAHGSFSLAGGRALLRAFVDLGPRARAKKFDARAVLDPAAGLPAAQALPRPSVKRRNSCFQDGFGPAEPTKRRERAPSRRGQTAHLPEATRLPASTLLSMPMALPQALPQELPREGPRGGLREGTRSLPHDRPQLAGEAPSLADSGAGLGPGWTTAPLPSSSLAEGSGGNGASNGPSKRPSRCSGSKRCAAAPATSSPRTLGITIAKDLLANPPTGGSPRDPAVRI